MAETKTGQQTLDFDLEKTPEIILTMSAIKEWRNCKRRYRYKYIDLVREAIVGETLFVGSKMHDGLELFLLGKSKEECLEPLISLSDEEKLLLNNKSEYELARVRAMMRAFLETYDDKCKLKKVSAEENISYWHNDRILIASKLDGLMKKKNKLELWEHKTTSMDISNAGEDYWIKLAIDTQLTIYSESVRRNFGKIPSIIYNVIRKPALRPKGLKSSNPETFEEFEDRCFEVMATDNKKYFSMRDIHRTKEQHEKSMQEINETIEEMISYDGVYPCNDSLCQMYGGCPYLGVCSGTEDLDSPRFIKLETAHPELNLN